MSDAVEQVYGALVRGELDDADLSARRLGAFLGKTTSVVYHHHGSVDGLLFAVSQRGYADLRLALEAAFAKKKRLADVAQRFVEFGLDHPELYPLMFERRFDWSALREAGAFEPPLAATEMIAALLCLLEKGGSGAPIADGRLFVAGLHGLVSFAASGRMNTGSLERSDREIAIAAARDLADRLIPKKGKKR